MSDWSVAVLARAPVPGRAKTRMCPPLTAEDAARLQRACIEDVLARYADRADRTLWIDAPYPTWEIATAAGWEVAVQPSSTLGRRMEAALIADRVVAVVGTDSPDLPRSFLDEAARSVAAGCCDAALVPAADGGFCALVARGLPEGALDGIPWSQACTLERTCARLAALGLRSELVGGWYDLDTVADLRRLQLESARPGADVPHRVVSLLRAIGRWAEGLPVHGPTPASERPRPTEREHE